MDQQGAVIVSGVLSQSHWPNTRSIGNSTGVMTGTMDIADKTLT